MNPIFSLWNDYILNPLLDPIDDPNKILWLFRIVGITVMVIVFLIIRSNAYKQENLV